MSRKRIDSKQITLPLPESQSVWETKGIFSEHYIRTRLQGSKLWPKEEKVKSLWELSSNLWNKLHIALGRGNEELTKREFLEPILKKLGFACLPESGLPSGGTPDYLLFADESTKENVLAEDKAIRCSAAISLLEAKKVNHPLDAASKQETPGRFPHQQVRDYLQNAADDSGKPYFHWAILTNGNLWRLYCRDAHPRSYFEFNLERASLKDFAIFIALFSSAAFIKDSEGQCPLDYLRNEALQHQSALEDDLRKRIFSILEQLANGFYRRPENKIKENELNKLYENCLIFLYRLLFVLYAEGRGLLPVKPYGTTGANANYLKGYSLQRLLPRLKNPLDFSSDELPDIYEDMLKLFHLINGDQPSRNRACDVPLYNGGLFDPTKKYALLENWRIGEKTLANVLRRLISANIPKGVGEQESFDFKETVDYAGLEVRQLGSIYEGLLEKHLNPKEDGTLELKGDKTERKATGTYYTPDYIVQYIVDNTLKPLCDEINKSLKVQGARKKEIKDNSFAKAVLKLKVLDPAMGSGHFLVRAVEFLADEIVKHKTTELQTEVVSNTLSREEIISHGKMPVSEGLSQEQEEIAYWRRRVVESCIYGVDLNPLAVELAKLSLWLTCISTKRPLSFLDHHLRPGNSLIGAKLKELGELPKKKETKELHLFTPDLPKAVSSAIQKLKAIEETESKDVSAIKDKEIYWQEVRKELKPYRDVADLWTSTFFGTKIDETAYQQLAKLMVQNSNPCTKEALKLKKKLKPYLSFLETAKDKMFFHWELEFPEVFFNEDGTPKENPGFDAVIGNPPYETSREKSIALETKEYLSLFPVAEDKYDYYWFFINRGNQLIRNNKLFAMILPDTWLMKPLSTELRKYLLENTSILSIDMMGFSVFKQIVPTCILKTTKPTNKENEIIFRDKKFIEVSTLLQSIYLKPPYFFINPFLNTKAIEIYQKAKKQSSLLGNIFCEIYNGVQTGNDKKYLSKQFTDKLHRPIIRGADVNHYSIQWSGTYILWIPKEMHSNQKESIYLYSPKILIRQTADKLIAALDRKKNISLATTFVLIKNTKSKEKEKYLLTILNSALLKYIYQSFNPEVGRIQPQIKRVHIESLPIRRIAFVTRKEEWEKLVEKLKAKVKAEKFDEVLEIVEECLPKDRKGDFIAEKEKSDVVHDLLAYLAEQMIEMNKEKQKLIKEFLTWLEKEITKASIESFKNKTKIKKFHEYDLDTLIEVLKQNRILVEVLDFGDKRYEALEKAFDTTISQLAPLKKKIKTTDELIDQIVYKLYGLTEEEIKIVESH